MPVEGVNGILNVESAALHAPQVGVANTNPQHILSVGSNLYVSGDSPDVLTVDGNVVCEGVKVGLIEIIPSYDLEAVANVGNSTSNTIQFTNPDTGIVTTGNVSVGKDLNVTGNLNVLGTTTTIDTDNLRVQDPIIELGKDNAGTGDLGLVMTRPSGSSNVAVIFDEDTDTLEIGYTQNNASDTDITMDSTPLSVNVNGNLSVTSNAEVGTANLFVDTTTGRVGIGKTDPGAALDVVGDVEISSNLAVDTNTLFVDSVGNKVGIGTTDPQDVLHIYQNSTSADQLRLQNDDQLGRAGLSIYNAAAQSFAIQHVGGPTSASNAAIIENFSTVNGGIGFYVKGDGDYTFRTTDSNNLRMIIKNDGNVGIGTNNPGNPLVIYGPDQVNTFSAQCVISSNSTTGVINSGGTLLFQGHDGVNGRGWATVSGLKENGTSGNYASYLRFDTRSNGASVLTERMRINSSGKVGIGTTDPKTSLHVGVGDAILRIGAVDYAGNSANTSTYGLERSRNQILFSTWRDAQKDKIGAKICGINKQTYSPAPNDLHLIQSTDLAFYTVRPNAGNYDDTSERLRITDEGRVGINDSTPSYTLDVNGSLNYTSGGLNSSDDRIKYNEQGVSNALTLISQLNPQKYEKIMERPNPCEGTWIPTDEEWENVKEDYKYGDEFGFIAQDVRNIPELAFLVHGEETRTDTKTSTPEEYSNLTTEEQSTYTISYLHESNVVTQEQYSNLSPEEQEVSVTQYTKQIETQTPLALNYQGLFVVAIGAIKELKAKNDALEARITALENA
jgi:hypothetical protein